MMQTSRPQLPGSSSDPFLANSGPLSSPSSRMVDAATSPILSSSSMHHQSKHSSNVSISSSAKAALTKARPSLSFKNMRFSGSHQSGTKPAPLSLASFSSKQAAGVGGWPGSPVAPPTPLANPPTPLSHPGSSPFIPPTSSPNKSQGTISQSPPRIQALRMQRGEGSKDMVSPFALPSHQKDGVIAYNLDAKGSISTFGPISPPLTPTHPQSLKGNILPQLRQEDQKTPPPSNDSKAAGAHSISAKHLAGKTLHPSFDADYVIESELGSGGFGFVVQARRKRDGLAVAVKFIFRERIPGHGWVRAKGWNRLPDGRPDHTEKLVPMEAYVLRMVRHKGVVAFLDLLEDETFFYLIMEHHGTPWQSSEEAHTSTSSPGELDRSEAENDIRQTPGLSFSSSRSDLSSSPDSSSGPPTPISPIISTKLCVPPPMIRRSSCDLFECIEQHQRLPEEQARYIFSQIVDAVYYLAAMGICHRDIKDENIVVDQDFRVKLIDFGSAIIYDIRKPPPYHNRFFGTVNFAASEILQGKPYRAPHAEIWSLGVLLSVLLTGETPFHDPTNAIKGRLTKPKVPISRDALDLMLGCLEVDPEQRYTIHHVKQHPWLRYPSAQ